MIRVANTHRKPTTAKRLFALLACSAVCLFLPPTLSAADSLSANEQAKLYRHTLNAINKGHRTNTRTGMQQLQDYPLYPYLEKAELSKRLYQLPSGEVDAFLQKYPDTVVATQLHKRWLDVLASKKQWSEFVRYYDPAIAGSDLRCHYLEALHQTGHHEIALAQTGEVWLSGKSLPDSCDAVFKRWQQAGMDTDQRVWQRVQLALTEGNPLLARYLSNHASAALQPYTRRMISVHYKPTRLRKLQDFTEQNSYTADILAHGLQRLASRKPNLASDLWVQYRGEHALSAEQNFAVRDKIARQLIASGSDDTLKWLITQDPNAEDSYLLEWRIRLALRSQQWIQASHWIGILPEKLQQHPRWRYWLARCQQTDNPEAAKALLSTLAGERNYYGFLAADLLQKPYDFNDTRLDAPTLQNLSQIPAIARAQVFFEMDELTAARREWRAALAQFNQSQLADATNLAHRWGWHQQAIHTTIKANQLDDLTVRFPLAYQPDMTSSAEKASIRLDWLYAITRQESAFAADARSSADARGLMQLRPATAQQVAKTLGIPFSSGDLYRATTNITLGSNYLKQLLNEYDGNHILATAAYNAGPHKVNKWLRNQSGALPNDIWIETLPFYETRDYVQSVLAFSAIYSHRLGLDTPMLAPQPQMINFANN